MREIKFRGKTKEGEWVYGYVDATAYKDLVVIHSVATTYTVLPDTIGQYTGLKDKNGKEIYEGDILKTAFSNYVFGIVMHHSNGYFYINECQSLESDHRPLGEMLKMSIDETPCNFSIVGNIYDNPEMIEK